MVGITVDSGNFSFNKSDDVKSVPKTKEKLKILVLGGFSGDLKKDSLAFRKHYRVDKDNFDDVFSALKVSLSLPITEHPICFSSIDDLHPDHLYENIPLFDRYRLLLRKLKIPNQYNDAVESLLEHGLIKTSDTAVMVEAKPTGALNGLLESLLSSASAMPTETTIQRLIRQTVAPYVEAKENPQAEEYIIAVECAVNDVMRQIMHDSEFQKLEASWRSVDLLNRRLDTDRNCLLHIMDVTSAEVLEDLDHSKADLKNSGLYKRIVDDYSVVGEQRFDVIVVDFPMKNSEDLELLAGISEVVAETGAIVLSGVEFDNVNPSIIEDFLGSERGLALRSEECMQSTYVASPSFMLRLPYGCKTAPIESFKFEELAAPGSHPYYLWGSSAYLLLISLSDKVNGVSGLPIHVYTDDGETQVTPCSEYYLSSREVLNLEQKGCTVVQSVKGTNEVLISQWVAFSN